MSMKPIVPGCLCLVIVGRDAGRVVTAVRLVRSEDRIYGIRAGRDGWLVEAGRDVGVYAEWGLMRIDGGDEMVAQEQHEEQPA